MSSNPYKISETLYEMRRNLLRYEMEGCFFSPSEIRDFNELLLKLAQEAMKNAHELICVSWNENTRNRANYQPLNIKGTANVIPFPCTPVANNNGAA